MKKIGIIGVTGSIGSQTADIVMQHKDMFDVVFITAHRNEHALKDMAFKLGARHSFLTFCGDCELKNLILNEDLDIVVVASAGVDMLDVVYELVKKGVRLAHANKETIVSAGKIMTEAAKKYKSSIIPVDSEHSAIFQCLKGHNKEDVLKLVLTASGGAFRDYSPEQMENVTISQALKHPNWSMGKKITIDSATMMNKGLELIEAMILFDMPPCSLDVVIHPQSIVHSMVTYKDGATIAQLGSPDMRMPISYALGFPDRMENHSKFLDFSKAMELTFYSPDMKKYPCFRLALDVLKTNHMIDMIAMNAANEVAVEAFLTEKIPFKDIYAVIDGVLSSVDLDDPVCIDDVICADKRFRILASEKVAGRI